MSELTRLGSHTGHYYIDLDLVPDGTTVLDLGVGVDTAFVEALQALREVHVVGVDPRKRAKRHVDERLRAGLLRNYTLHLAAATFRGAPTRLYHARPGRQSRSTFAGHKNSREVRGAFTEVAGVCVATLIATAPSPVSLVKMDIEGGEYEVLPVVVAAKIPQIALEFHDKDITEFRRKDTDAAVARAVDAGYVVRRWYEDERCVTLTRTS